MGEIIIISPIIIFLFFKLINNLISGSDLFMMMYDNFNFANIPFLVVFMYLFVEILKKKWILTDKARSMLPIVCAFVGAGLACVLHYFFPYVLGTSNYFEALTMGAVSGLSATGCNQLFKQVRAFYEGEPNADEEQADILDSKARRMESEIKCMELEDRLEDMKKKKEAGITLDKMNESMGQEEETGEEDSEAVG